MISNTIYEDATQEYEDSPSPDGASCVPSKGFKVEQSSIKYGPLDPIREELEDATMYDEHTTYGEQAESRGSPLPRGVAQVIISDMKFQGNMDASIAYLQKLLVVRGCEGFFHLTYSNCYKDFYCFSFDKNDFCPLCKVKHEGYGFQYKVKPGCYGGWKCWKTGEWETQYVYNDYNCLLPQ